MIDGDIFTAPLGADRSQFTVARKPEHIQRAVWQKVYDSDYEPLDPSELSRRLGMPWAGPPFAETGFDFGELDNRRVWTHDGDGTASLAWRWDRLPITDWVTYNVLRSRMPSGRPVPGAGKSPYAVSDIRFGAAIDARSPEALVAEYTLTTRRRVMRFMLGEGKATLRIETQPEDAGEAAKVLGEASVPFTPPTAGKPLALECWHVDQRLSLWINDVEIVRLDDVFESLEDRVLSSYFGRTVEDYARRPWFEQPTPPQLSFTVRGSALDLHRARRPRHLLPARAARGAAAGCGERSRGRRACVRPRLPQPRAVEGRPVHDVRRQQRLQQGLAALGTAEPAGHRDPRRDRPVHRAAAAPARKGLVRLLPRARAADRRPARSDAGLRPASLHSLTDTSSPVAAAFGAISFPSRSNADFASRIVASTSIG
jgi:hypothetical protein